MLAYTKQWAPVYQCSLCSSLLHGPALTPKSGLAEASRAEACSAHGQDLRAAVAGFEQVAREYIALLQQPHTDAELRAMEARKAASRAHFNRVLAAYRAQMQREMAAAGAARDARGGDSSTAGLAKPAASDAEQALSSLEEHALRSAAIWSRIDELRERAVQRAATSGAPAASASQAAGAGSPAGPGPSPSTPTTPTFEALQRARARDRARRPAYDDSDYEEESPAGASSGGVLRPGSGGMGARGGGVGRASALDRAGGEDRVRAGVRGGREPGRPGAGKPGGGREFEAGAGLDARSAAALARLDTFQQAEEEFPAWEEELFGSPAGAMPPCSPAGEIVVVYWWRIAVLVEDKLSMSV